MAGKYGIESGGGGSGGGSGSGCSGGGSGGGGGKRGNNSRLGKFSLPGQRAPPGYPLCTPAQIRKAELSELRKDERVWAAYERGWNDLMIAYMNVRLTQDDEPSVYHDRPPCPAPPGENVNGHRYRPRYSRDSAYPTNPGHGDRCCGRSNGRAHWPAQLPDAVNWDPTPDYPFPPDYVHPVAPVPPVGPRRAAPVPGAEGSRLVNEIEITVTGCSPDVLLTATESIIVKVKIVSPQSTEIHEFTKRTTSEVNHERPMPPQCESESTSEFSNGSFSDCDSAE